MNPSHHAIAAINAEAMRTLAANQFASLTNQELAVLMMLMNGPPQAALRNAAAHPTQADLIHTAACGWLMEECERRRKALPLAGVPDHPENN